MSSWLLIDDSPEEAAAFAARLSEGRLLSIDYMTGTDAAAALGADKFAPAGVLMDVDLSNEMGRQQTGPGMSQDMRVAQQRQTIPPFPIVRFSLRDKVLENIGRDSSSDDIFDLKIEKDGLSDDALRAAVQSKLIGVRQIYDALNKAEVSISTLLGLDEELWSRWGSPEFQSTFEVGDRVHLKASPLVRMMIHPGLLIDEDLLAFRLGIDPAASEGWPALREQLTDYAYAGVAGGCFVRWWARGIEEWWQDKLGAEVPLAGCNIAQRMEILSQHFSKLAPLRMPKGSLGDRPWRFCLLTQEQRQEIIPIDPARAVRMKPRAPMPSWLDPLYAALGVALQNRDDPRLDKDDLKRLQLFARSR
jgi:hypothetical protein